MRGMDAYEAQMAAMHGPTTNELAVESYASEMMDGSRSAFAASQSAAAATAAPSDSEPGHSRREAPESGRSHADDICGLLLQRAL